MAPTPYSAMDETMSSNRSKKRHRNPSGADLDHELMSTKTPLALPPEVSQTLAT